jgi:hypothetical protein
MSDEMARHLLDRARALLVRAELALRAMGQLAMADEIAYFLRGETAGEKAKRQEQAQEEAGR